MMTMMTGGRGVARVVVIAGMTMMTMTDGRDVAHAAVIAGMTTMMTVGRDGIEDPHPHAALISEALITHHHLLQDLHGDGIIATTLNPSMDQGALGTIVRHITSFCRHLNP